jgi:hypothetical protein
MIQPKYSPEEALNKIKLMMNYDSSKTLNENRLIITEQTQADPNQVSEETVSKVAQSISDLMGAQAFGVEWTTPEDDDWKKIKSLVLSLAGKTLNGQNAISSMMETYQLLTDNDLLNDIKETGKHWYSSAPGTFMNKGRTALGEKIRKSIVDMLENPENVRPVSGTTPPPTAGTTPPPTAGGKTPPATGLTPPVGSTTYKICPETFPIAMYCKNETIRAIQKCLGVGADSAFGPITQKALTDKGFLGTSISQDTYNKVCGGSSQTNQPANNDEQDVDGEDANEV